MHGRQPSGDGEENPFKGGKGSAGLSTLAHGCSAVAGSAEGDCGRDEAGEPEDHCDRLDSQDDERMGGLGEESRSEQEEGHDDDDRPDGRENEKVDLVQTRLVTVFAEPGRHIALETEDQDGENYLRDAQWEHEVDGHLERKRRRFVEEGSGMSTGVGDDERNRSDRKCMKIWALEWATCFPQFELVGPCCCLMSSLSVPILVLVSVSVAVRVCFGLAIA
jgi:hypothetical protein